VKNDYQIIQKLLLTEKAMAGTEAAKKKKYVFKVHPSANKLEIKRAVETLFGVKVSQVNTSNRMGKTKRERTASYGRTADSKRAVVTLLEGQTIALN
jgi:large subunit ribosomal protein L23